MGENKAEKTISLLELWNIFVKKWIIVVGAGLIAMVGFFVYEKLNFVPQYTSTATLSFSKEDTSETELDAKGEFEEALKVVDESVYLLKSHTVLDDVLDSLEFSIPYSSLCESIVTNHPENTRLLEVSVSADSPEKAKKIVDNICDIGSKKIETSIDFKHVKVYEYGNIAQAPSNVLDKKKCVGLGLIVMFVVYLICAVKILFGGLIGSNEDIERVLSVNVIGEIPDYNKPKKTTSAYYKDEYIRNRPLDKEGHN